MILVVSSPNTYASKRLMAESKKLSIPLKIVPANELSTVNLAPFKVLYIRNPFVNKSPEFLPQVIALAKKFKRSGKKVVDDVVANGDLALGKWDNYKRLKLSGIPIPKTELLSDYPLPTTHYPLILKWIYGFKAREVFFVANELRLKEIFSKFPKNELLIQEFIPAKYEYKIITVGYKALPVATKFKIKDLGFKIDFSSASSVPIRGLPSELIEMAETAAKVLGRQLSKVDILESHGKFYVLEVNRCPGLKSFERITKHNVVKAFLDYLYSL